jgi:thioredoxin 1
MSIAIYLLAGLALTWALFYAYMYLASKSIEGRPTQDLQQQLPQLSAFPDRALIYCHSPKCGPCRQMSPVIDELAAEGQPVVKLDLSEYPALASDLGVRAAPTLLLVERDVVKEVVLGVRSRRQIEALLQAD